VLTSRRLPPEELQCGIETIEDGREDVRKVMILPNGLREATRARGSTGAKIGRRFD
jgi:hypothetical protein